MIDEKPCSITGIVVMRSLLVQLTDMWVVSARGIPQRVMRFTPVTRRLDKTLQNVKWVNQILSRNVG